MKFYLTLIFVNLFLFSNSQNRFRDTSSTCIAFWKKGEEKSYLITHIKEKTKGGKLEPQANISYVAKIAILDSFKTGYKIQWIFTLSEKFKAENPFLIGLMPAFEDMKLVYLTTETGMFKELINWQEVKDAYITMFEMGVKDKTDSSYLAGISKTKELFNSREMVEGTLIREIKMFHSPFGYEYSTNEKNIAIELPNPFSKDDLLPGSEISKIVEINPKSDYFKLLTKQVIDTSALRKLLESMYVKLNLPKEEIVKNINDLLSTMKIDDSNEYKITLSSGWPERFNYSRIVNIENSEQIETYVFELKE